MIHQPLGEQVHDFPFALKDAEYAEQAGGEEFAALAFGEVGDLPVDNRKVAAWFAGISVPLMILLAILL